MTLVEALRLSRAVQMLPNTQYAAIRSQAQAAITHQQQIFAAVPGPADAPGQRDEALFSARVARVTASHPICPLLENDLCSIYAGRPFLCRAYGYATDAYMVESGPTKLFRSLCILYEDVQLHDYVRAKELREELTSISRDLAKGREAGRFTLPEAILSHETLEAT